MTTIQKKLRRVNRGRFIAFTASPSLSGKYLRSVSSNMHSAFYLEEFVCFVAIRYFRSVPFVFSHLRSQALFEGTFFGQAARDEFQTILQADKVKSVILQFFTENFPTLEATIEIFGLFQRLTVHGTPPTRLLDLCADSAEFEAFINFFVTFTSALGLDFTEWKNLVGSSGVYFNIISALRPLERVAARQRLLAPSLIQSYKAIGGAIVVANAHQSNYGLPPPAARLPTHLPEMAVNALGLRNTFAELSGFGLGGAMEKSLDSEPSASADANQSRKLDQTHLGGGEQASVLFAKLGPERDSAGCIPGIDPPLDQGKKSFCYAFAFGGGCNWPQCNFNHYSQLELSAIPCKFHIADGSCKYREQCVYKHGE